MRVHQAYRFALNPSPRQERMLASHAGAPRFAWNWGLGACRDRYKAEGKWYSAAELHRLWNAEKKADPRLSWWGENSKCVYQESFRDLERALRDYVKSRKDERQGRRLGLPRFKKRGRSRDAFRFSTGVLRCAGATVTLPRLGTIRTQEWNGGRLVVAGRFYPSSKTCSGCGAVKAKLPLSERIYRCAQCGLVLDRGVNAARNLLNLAASGAERRNACGAAMRPGRPGHAAVNQEPGTACADKPGTDGT